MPSPEIPGQLPFPLSPRTISWHFANVESGRHRRRTRPRAEIRAELGFRAAIRADDERLTAWLAAEVCPVELVQDRQREIAVVRSASSRRGAPSGFSRQPVVVADEDFCAQTVARLPEQAVVRLDELVADHDHEVLAPDDERVAVGGP